MKAFTLVILFFIPLLTHANTIIVGETSLSIASPKGYSVVTSDMEVLFEYQKQFVGATNNEFISFIKNEEVQVALANEIPELERRFSVQTANNLISGRVTLEQFHQMKEIVKTQNNEIISEAQELIKTQFDGINTHYSEKQEIDLALSLSQMRPLPVHQETEQSLAYSIYVNYSVNDEVGMPKPFIGITTVTFVYVKGKILFLYSFAGEFDLQWSQNVSKQWSEKIIKANPEELNAINRFLYSINIDWNAVGIKALVGGILGGVIGLISWLMQRRKSKKDM